MAIPFSCRECGQLYQVDESLAGKRAKCKKCQAVMEVPGRPKPALQTFGAPESRPGSSPPTRRPPPQDVPTFNAYDDVEGDPYAVADLPPPKARAVDDELMAPRRVGTSKPSGKKPRLDPATIWQRFCAQFGDNILMSIANFVIGLVAGSIFLAGGHALSNGGANVLGGLIWLVTWFFYYPCRISSEAQATPGKSSMGIHVVDMSGRRVSLPRATGREAAKVASVLTFGIGYLVAFFNPERRTLHDYIAGTRVVRN